MKAEWTNKDSLLIDETTGRNSKAILVINMPEGCNGCPCLDDEERYCRADEKYFRFCGILGQQKPEWCPLKPMPQRKRKIKELSQYTKEYEAYCKGEVDGWNFCLDEILGEENADKKEE